MRTNARRAILDAALQVVNEPGGAITFDSVSKSVGMTKAGLMYHFATKELLMTAVVEHVVDRWKAEMAQELGTPVEESTLNERVAAFVRFACGGGAELADFVVFSESFRDPVVAEPWIAYLRAWFDFGPDPDFSLLMIWLAANGAWLVEATGVVPLAAGQREKLLTAMIDAAGALRP